jgi:hypothetical protein
MQIDTSKLASIITLAALTSLLVSITSTTYAQKQMIQHIMIATGTATSSISPQADNITLGNPSFNYTGYDKTTSFKPNIVNGTHEIQVSFTGHGILNSINTTDNGSAVITNGTNGKIFTLGKGMIVSKNGAGTVTFEFQGIGHYGADGKLRDTGEIWTPHQAGPGVEGTGKLAFLSDTNNIYKDVIDKAGNSITKFWFWK